MADQTNDSNDTQRNIEAEDRNIQQRQHGDETEQRDNFQRGSSSMPGGGSPDGQFAHQETSGDSAGATARESASNPATGAGGAQPGGTDRGAKGGSMTGTTGSMTSGASGEQGVGSGGTIGGTDRDTLTQGPAASESSLQAGGSSPSGSVGERPQGLSGPDHEDGAMGGSVTAAGGGSNSPGSGQTGTERDSSEGGFIGSQSGDNRDEPNQGGFAEQGRGAPEGSEPSGPEGSGERTANLDSDFNGSSSRSS